MSRERSGEEGVRREGVRVPLASLPRDSHFAGRIFFRPRRQPVHRLVFEGKEHSKIKFVSTSGHVMFCLLYQKN